MSLMTNKTISNPKNQHHNTKQNLAIQVIEDHIEEIVKFIENELHLNDRLITNYLPALVKKSTYQLKLLLNELGSDSLDFLVPAPEIKHINNFFIRTLLYQMKYLKNANPLALLTWLVILFRTSKLIYSNLCIEAADYAILHWKEMALHWICDTSPKEITTYQTSLASHLINSTR